MNLHSLSGPFLSVLGPAERLPLRHFSDRSLAAYQCKSAEISRIFNYVRDWDGRELSTSGLYGAACEFDPKEAELKALGEAAERYTSAVLSAEEFKIATADELGDQGFDWKRLPQLSTKELSDPKQMLHPFSPQDSMRWIEAIDMHKRVCVYVPIVLTHLYPRAWTSERFIYPISTGTALHPAPWQAMLSAVLEVIERDALSLNWILRRPLRRIQLQLRDARFFDEKTWKLLQQDDVLLYEATTDFGIPVVYARRFRAAHPKAANVFGCACSFDVCNAIGKAARESIMIAHALESNAHQVPDDAFECRNIIDGASMMMAPERNAEFAFLDRAGNVGLDELLDKQPIVCGSPRAQFEWVMVKTKQHEQPLYIAEISCDEIKHAGLRAFRAVMPGLMPLSFVHRARFLGSRRLSDMYQYWNLPGTLEERINPWPQPFS